MTSRLIALLASFLFISACGSSGGDSSSPPPPPPPPPPPANEAPVVDAGADATIQLPNNSVVLDATVTDDGLPDGATVTLLWSVSAGPDGVVFDDATTEDPTVTFPGEGTYELTLTANDSELEGSDTVQITVDVPVAGAPVADDQAVSTPQDTAVAITLTGTDPDGDALTFATDSAPTNGTLSGTAPDLTYTPNAGFTGDDSFTFTVSDGELTSAPATVSITVTSVVATGEEAYWTFDEGTGTVAADSLGDNDATLVDVLHNTELAVNGAAVDFNSSDDRVVVDDAAALDITGNQISLVAWINPRNNGKSGFSRIISKRTGAEVDGADVYGMSLKNFQLRFTLDGGAAFGGQDMDSTQFVRLDDWTHVAMVYNGADMRIYVNGELDAATPVAKSDPIDSSDRAVHIGRFERDSYGGSADSRDFVGLIDEVQVLGRALSESEVQALYQQFTPPTVAGLYFTDYTDEVRNGIFPRGGQAVAWAEATDDEFPDFAISGAEVGFPHGDHFYENLPSFSGNRFRERGQEYGLRDKDDDSGSHGIVWADLDNDGDYDQVNGSTWAPNTPNPGNPVANNVFENPGNVGGLSGTFTENTDADIAGTPRETYGVAAFDMDADGDLDLFGVADSDNPGSKEAYLNDGNLGFSPHAGGDLTSASVPTMWGVTDTDYDGDGDVDVISANRGTAGGFDGEFTILNNNGSGSFTRVLPSNLGITLPGDNKDEAKSGITTADIDNDGDLDMLLTSPNLGGIWFNDGNGAAYTQGDTFGGTMGYMGAFADLDNDGDQDLVFAGDERVWINRGDGTFTSGQSIPVGGISDPRSIGFADFDNDGDLDFAISVQGSDCDADPAADPNVFARCSSRLIRNDWDNAANNWLKVQLVSPDGQAGAFGAKTYVYEAGSGQSVLLGMRESKSSAGYLSQSDPVLHFGLGDAAVVDVVVQYLDGTTATCVNVAANARQVITGSTCN